MKVAIYIWAVFSFLVCFLLVILRVTGLSGPIDGCYDDGGVWDDEHEVCRFDCRKWIKEKGCIMLTDEELEEYVNGYCKGDGKGLYRCNQASAELSKRKQWQEMKGINK